MADFFMEQFEGGTLQLDGHSFDSCRFVGVALVWDGREHFSFALCDFADGTTLQFGNPAAMIAYTIGSLWNHSQLGPAVQQLVLEKLPQSGKALN